jgi:hypothetical protein
MLHTNDVVDRAIVAIRRGEKTWGRELLVRALRDNEHDERAWLWMSAVVMTTPEQRYCLSRVVELNEENWDARAGLAQLGAGPARRPVDLVEPAAAIVLPAVPIRTDRQPRDISSTLDFDDEPEITSANGRSLALIAVLLIAVLVGVIIVMLGGWVTFE